MTIAGIDSYDKPNMDGKLYNKQNKFIIAETVPTNAARLFDANNTKFRAINVNSPLSISTPNFEYVSLSCDAYDKANIDGKITTINTNVTAKQATLSNGETVENSKTLLVGNKKKI